MSDVRDLDDLLRGLVDGQALIWKRLEELGLLETPAAGTVAPHALVSATHTAAGLTTGQALRATSATAFAFGAIDLSNANAITGAGMTAGQALLATGASTLALGAIDLANANAVTGALPVGHGGTGLSGTPANGQLPIGNATGFTLAALTGTANRVTVTNGAGTITLSGPQDLDTAAAVTFGKINLGAATGAPTGGIALRANATNDLVAQLQNTSGAERVQFQYQAAGDYTFAMRDSGGTQRIILAPSTPEIDLAKSTGVYKVNGTQVVGARASAYTQTYATATKTHANPTGATVTPGAGAFGASSAVNFAAMVTSHNAMIADIANIKQVLNAVIDDGQAHGLYG